VLDVPVAYFYAEEDELAALIIEFHGNRKLPGKLISIQAAGYISAACELSPMLFLFTFRSSNKFTA